MSGVTKKTIVILGATGYVGGRLVPQLLEAGYSIRAVSRSIQKLEARSWATHPNVELVMADVTNPESLTEALEGAGVVFYLVHSMNSSHRDFATADRLAAQMMVDAAETAHLDRIIYLGGLGEDTPDLSKHLRSRAEVAQILRQSTVPATILRAAMIIGSGSASFEILRYLVDRLPIMITPQWVNTPSQPIAIQNVLNYLKGCLENPETTGRTFDIGGPDIVTYRQLMKIYEEEAGLPKRWIIPVPVFSPRLSSYWIHFITPVPAYIARPLAEGLRNPAICKENTIQTLIPQKLLSCQNAIHLALEGLQNNEMETHWTDAGELPRVEEVYPGDPTWAGGTAYKDQREIIIQASPVEVWEHLICIGGKKGWYYGNTLWRLRGILDRLFGGVGAQRGRRNPLVLKPGDALDLWRVVDLHFASRLKLLAEMKLPGKAFLNFELQPQGEDRTRLIQTAWFIPRGLIGCLYWYSMFPMHHLVFNGMLRGIATATGKMILSGPNRI